MKRSLILLWMLCLVLCACGDPETETIHTQPLCETEITEPIVSETVVFEQVPHITLYHPGCSLYQIREYFEEVVLDAEYSDGTGDTSLVQKWLSPIRYRIFGCPTEEDLAVLEGFFAHLNAVPGFPGIFPAEEDEVENLRLSFLEPDVFRDSFSYVVNGEDAFGATEFWYYTDTNELYSARIGYRTDLDQNTRNSVLIEEIVNTLGISDTLLREDSITYQYSNENMALSDVDWILLRLLYHPEIQCGMDASQCAAVIEQLYG